MAWVIANKIDRMRLGNLDLALNPGAKVTVFANVTPPVFQIEAPLRGDTLKTSLVHSHDAPAAHEFLVSALVTGDQNASLGEQALSELHGRGLFVTPDKIPSQVDYDLSPFDPTPTGANAEFGPQVPYAWLDQATLSVPEAWQKAPLSFAPYLPGGLWVPQRALPDVPGPATLCLAQFDSAQRIEAFARDGYAELPGLLPEVHVAAMGRFFRELAAEGFLERHTDKTILRHIAHNHPVTEFWHRQLNERVSRLVGRRTKPSYSFVSYYLEGGDLFWHTDRDPCEYTITLLVDYDPVDVDGHSAWALQLKDRSGQLQTIRQRLGDALIFKGRELPHSRERKPDGHRSGSVLFHFVDEDFEGNLS